MPIPEHLIKRFGGIDKVPDYIKKHYADREDQKRQREEEANKAKQEQEAEWARIKALRRPPQNVRLERVGTYGMKIVWDPPETADEMPPAGYWVSEKRNGEWTKHGDYLLPEKREAFLYGQGPASVETWYHQMALGELYPSEQVHFTPPEAPDTREDKIDTATRNYEGKRTKREGKPYVRSLRKRANMPDITTQERDESHQRMR